MCMLALGYEIILSNKLYIYVFLFNYLISFALHILFILLQIFLVELTLNGTNLPRECASQVNGKIQQENLNV